MPKQKQYFYRTNCVNSTAPLINAMTENAREVTLATMRRNCADLGEWEKQMKYCRGGLTLSKDWAVSYWKSTYGGKPCYYLVHSAIEHIWTKES